MNKLLTISFLSVLFIINGCFNVSTYQMPYVLKDDEKTLGAGVVAFGDTKEMNCCGVEVYGRAAAFKNIDIGLKLAGLPSVGSVAADIKYQLFENPFYGSIDLAYTYISLSLFDEDISFLQITPGFFIGTERIFGGVKLNYFTKGFSKAASGDIFSSKLLGLFIGTSFGNDVKLLPVLNVYFPISKFEGDPLFVPNLGLQYTW